jgi:hypothetical protein
MNDKIDLASDDLPSPPTLRRHYAITCDEDLNQRFVDKETLEFVSGNPDLSHPSNKNLVKLILWQSGRCNPNSFFSNNHHDDENNLIINATVECSA